MSSSAPIDGTWDEQFKAVRDAFVQNFEVHGERGAAVSIFLNGRVVVDLWGGFTDAQRKHLWGPDTLVNVFSVGKAPTSLCALILVDREELELDAPVCAYWAEFEAAGKERITLRQLLSHQAGLPAIREDLPPEALFDWDTICNALAEQETWWEAGTKHGYHVNTFGFLVGEMVRRVSGISLGQFLKRTISEPLGLDLHIGLPASEHSRVAEFIWPGPSGPAGLADPDDPDQVMQYKTYFNPQGISGHGIVNSARWRSGEIPSANCHSTARSIARLYACLASGGSLEGVDLISRDLILEAAREHSSGPDAVIPRSSRFGLGFQLTQPERPLGPNANVFGHFGAGGSLGFADPDAEIGFGYVMNVMGPRWQNPTNRNLIDALYSCL